MKRLRIACIVVLAGGAIAGASLLGANLDGGAKAHSGATGVVKQRMDAMVDVGKRMKSIAAMVKGETAFDATQARIAAGAIAGHAGDIPDLFPKGTKHKPSEATAAIWREWERFVAIAQKLEADAQSLSKAAGTAGNASDIAKQFAAVGKSCKTCHESFRLKKK